MRGSGKAIGRLGVAGVLLLLAVPGAHGVKMSVAPGRTECFTETVKNEHFQVQGGPRIDGRVLVSGNSQYYVPFVSIKLLGPENHVIWSQDHVYSESHFNVAAPGAGSYQVCFFNPYDSRTDATIDMVYFTVAHLRSNKAGKLVVPRGTADERGKEVASTDHMEEVQRTIMGMSEFVSVIQGSQRYLQRKLDHHIFTLESSNNRTLRYSLLEAFVVLAVVGVQVAVITKFFDKIKLLPTSKMSV